MFRCGLIPREWNSWPPVVVPGVVTIVTIVASPIVIAAIASVTSSIPETVNVADVSQLLLNLTPVGVSAAVKSAADAIELIGFLKHSLSFVGAAIQVAPIADSRFQI